MDLARHSGFAHRENNDGTFDSICVDCYPTDVRSHLESGLELWEQTHTCDPVALERFNRRTIQAE